MTPELKQGQRFLYKTSGTRFIAEVTKVHDSSFADMKVVQDLGAGMSLGYVFNSMKVADTYYWEYLPGQEAPTNG